MSQNLKNKRGSRRYVVRNMGYSAFIAVGKERREFPVLDFSANGIQLEIPLSATIPNDGKLYFRDQAYFYCVRYESADENSKRIGVETVAVPTEETAHKSRSNPFFAQSAPGQQSVGPKGLSVVLWSIGFSGIAVALALVYGGAATADGRNNDSFWNKLSNTVRYSTATPHANYVDLSTTAKAGTKSKASSKATSDANVNAGLQKASDAIDRAKTLLTSANYEGVIEACDTAITANSRNASAWHLKGVALDKLAIYDQAIRNLRQAISLNSTDPMIHADLAQTYCDAGRFNEGLKQIQKGYELTEGELRLRFKQLVATVYEARSADRRRNEDSEGARDDLSQAARWRR